MIQVYCTVINYANSTDADSAYFISRNGADSKMSRKLRFFEVEILLNGGLKQCGGGQKPFSDFYLILEPQFVFNGLPL